MNNIIDNNALASLTRRAAPQIVSAIKQASARTGVNFAYLMEQAAAESSFNAKAEAKTSSAAGLYQFIESTWLGMVKKYGHKHGMGALAGKISAEGKVADTAARQEILALRKDPEKAALLAAEFAAENKRYLERHVGGEIGATELYFAHFMGAAGAAGFLNTLKENPLQTAADLFPREARANHNVFYDSKTGAARSLAGVYEFFAGKFKASNAGPHNSAAPAKAQPDAAFRPIKAPQSEAGRAALMQDTVARLTLQPFSRPLSQMGQRPENAGWDAVTALASRGSLLFSPADLMLLTGHDLPNETRGRAGYGKYF